MNYSNNTRYIITAEDRNGLLGYSNRYIGLMYDENNEMEDFAIFYTIDGYLDFQEIYYSEDEANKALESFKNKYSGTGNKRYNSLINIRVKKIAAVS